MLKALRQRTRSVTRIEVIAIVCGTALISGGSAYAAATVINGASIKKGTVYLNRLSPGTQKLIRAKSGATAPSSVNKGDRGDTGARGATGAQGPAGTNGTNGTNGAQGETGPVGVGPEWGTIARNTIGNATAQLRSDTTAPLGSGSLQLTVGSGSDKIAFGNETTSAGLPVSDLTEVGYRVKTTGENSGLGVNMPSIGFETWTSGTVGLGYSTLNYSPTANSASNQWSPYIDAAGDPSNAWGLTGSAFNSPATSANCGINGPRCTFAQVKTLLTNPPYNAIIFSSAVGKGRDYAWNGQVDGLRINSTTYDFELAGVKSIPAP